MSKKAKYPIATQAKEKSPNAVSPRKVTNFGMAAIKTRKIQPSAKRFSNALRASNEDEVS
jgi:hypothetical protein